MAVRIGDRIDWMDSGTSATTASPGQLCGSQDFLRVDRIDFGSRSDRWKWSGFRAAKAPHGFEGVCASRAEATRAAEIAYFGD